MRYGLFGAGKSRSWLCATLTKTHAPAAQLSQLADPSFENLPPSQSSHSLAPDPDDLPAAQATHTDALAFDHVPLSHLLHALLAASE